MAETDRKATGMTGEGRVIIRDIALPKSVTLPPWFTDLAGSEERARRAKAAGKQRPTV